MARQANGEPFTGSSLTASPLQASPFSTKKKKKKIKSQKLNPINPSRRWRLASRRVVAGQQRDQSQYKSKPNRQTQNSANQTQSIEVFIKKKKKKSPIHKPKSNPVNHLPTDGHVAAVVAATRSSSFAWSLLIVDRRSENGERRSVLGVRRSVLPPALRQGISFLFLSDSFSVSSSLIFISVFLSVFSTSPSCRSTSQSLYASASAPVSGAVTAVASSGSPALRQAQGLKVSLYLSLTFSLFYLTE